MGGGEGNNFHDVTQPAINHVNHEYFIQAEEILWDYAPSGKNQINGEDLSPDNIYIGKYDGTVGKQVLKTVICRIHRHYLL